jgi:hypothetical protein
MAEAGGVWRVTVKAEAILLLAEKRKPSSSQWLGSVAKISENHREAANLAWYE